jgi:uncharacterized protein (DUF1778 family)
MAVKSERFDIRVSREHKRLIEKAARFTGQAVTSFVLSSALDRAREALGRRPRTVLSERDGRTFLRMLGMERAPAAEPALPAAKKAGARRSSP